MDRSIFALVAIVFAYFVIKHKVAPILAKRKAAKAGGKSSVDSPVPDVSGMGLSNIPGTVLPGFGGVPGVFSGSVPLSGVVVPAPSPIPGKLSFSCALVDLLLDEPDGDYDAIPGYFEGKISTILAALCNRGAVDISLDYVTLGVGRVLVCATYKLPSTAL